MRAWAVCVAVLWTTTVACGGGTSDDDVDAVSEVTETVDDEGVRDVEGEDDGTPAVECEMDFDCDVGSACRDGVCAATSPDGWCPRVFERPLRIRRLLVQDPLARWTDFDPISCGGRCLAAYEYAMLRDPDFSETAAMHFWRRLDGATEHTTLPASVDTEDGWLLAAATTDRGEVLLVSYLLTSGDEENPRVVVERLSDDTMGLVGEIPERQSVIAAKLQLAADGLVHLFLRAFEEQDLSYHVVVGEGDLTIRSRFAPEFGDPGEALVRPDGAVDLISAYYGDARLYWQDWSSSEPGPPQLLTRGYLPVLDPGTEGVPSLALIHLPLPAGEPVFQVFSMRLPGVLSDQRDVSFPSVLVDYLMDADGLDTKKQVTVLSTRPDETAILVQAFEDGPAEGEPDHIATWDSSGAVQTGELAANPIWATQGTYPMYRGSGPDRAFWYERCGGLRGAVHAVSRATLEGSLWYVEW